MLKKVHPWCKISQGKEEIKDESTQKVYPAKQQPSVESTDTSQRSLISSNSPKTEDTEDTEDNDNTAKGTKQKEKKEMNKNESFLSSLKSNIKYTQRKHDNPSMNKKAVLSIEEHEEAYPWEKEAAKNRENKTPLSNETKKITEGINKLLPQALKSKLYNYIEYHDNVNNKIDNKIEGKCKKYVCINCINNPSFSSTRRSTLQRHVKVELGYYIFKCSFCDEKSNDPRTLINHYASIHGVPSNWLETN